MRIVRAQIKCTGLLIGLLLLWQGYRSTVLRAK